MKISTPRSELNGAVIAVRLTRTVIQVLEYEEKPDKILFGKDSETVLAAREKGAGALGEYFGNRISEMWDLQSKIGGIVPVGVTGNGDSFHMPSKCNATDRATRLDSKVEDIMEGSIWQEGMEYLKKPFSDWPWERNFSSKKLTDLVPNSEIAARYRGLNTVSVLKSISTIASKEDVSGNQILQMFDYGFVTNDYD